jgi:hypothetical protein
MNITRGLTNDWPYGIQKWSSSFVIFDTTYHLESVEAKYLGGLDSLHYSAHI